MENERPINLKKYISKKTNTRLMIRIIIYALFLFIIGAFFLNKLSQNKPKNKSSEHQIHEIHGVKIEFK